MFRPMMTKRDGKVILAHVCFTAISLLGYVLANFIIENSGFVLTLIAIIGLSIVLIWLSIFCLIGYMALFQTIIIEWDLTGLGKSLLVLSLSSGATIWLFFRITDMLGRL